MDRVVRFIAKWSLVAVPDSPGEYLTADDIADGMLPRITAGTECFSISRPTLAEVDMAIDWMLTVGGSFLDLSGGDIISTDRRWLDVERNDPASRTFVVDDAITARAAHDGVLSTPPGTWDARDGLGAVPVVVRRIGSPIDPRVHWRGAAIVLGAETVRVQPIPSPPLWGVVPPTIAPGRSYLAEGWIVREIGGRLIATADERAVVIEDGESGPVVA